MGLLTRLLPIALLAIALPARAQRRLLSRDAQRVQAGERLAVDLELAHGLTPPPGIQNERALRGFAARLCAERAAEARERERREVRCVPLAVLNVRPRDGWSFAYRAEFALPAELAPGRYDLEVRFPGGSDGVAGGVVVEARPAPGARETKLALPAPSPSSAARHGSGCEVAPAERGGAALGLLLAAVSWKLAAGRRARDRRGNSSR